jgi:hypothetical protein
MTHQTWLEQPYQDAYAQADRMEAACDAYPLLAAMVDLRGRVDERDMPELACALDDAIARRYDR